MNLFSLQHSLRRITVAQRIAIWVFMICLLPLILIGVYGYLHAESALRRNADEYNRKVVDALRSNIELTIDTFLTTSAELASNATIREGLKQFGALTPQEKFMVNKTISADVKSKFHRITDVYDIRIVSLENEPVYTTGYLYLMDEYADEAFSKISSSRENILWFVTSINEQPYYVMATKVMDAVGAQPIGYIFCYILPSAFDDVFSGFQFGEGSRIGIVDSFGTAISGDALIDPADPAVQAVAAAADAAGVSLWEGGEALVYYTSVAKTGWKLFTTLPYAYLNSSILPIQIGTTVLVVVTMLLCVLLSRFISRSITVPLSRMTAVLEQASRMRFETRLTDDSRDELGYMAKITGRIIDNMQRLLHKIEQEQEQKRRAEIDMLQAQINPHFLFNTLDSLRFAAMMSNAPSVSGGLGSLSRLLRSSVTNENSIISIRQELDCIQDYLTIQKIRYGDVITFREEIQPGCEQAAIMKLLLQPVIENAVIHGMPEEGAIHIDVSITAQEDMLCVCVRDDGIGFDPEQTYDREKGRYKSSKMSGIGLENIRARLALEYGEQQSFSIRSSPGCGTTVTLRFPLRMIQQEDEYV